MQTVSRLIEVFVPEHYELSLTLDRINRQFAGTVTIDGALLPKMKSIVLHSKDLLIKSVTLDDEVADFATSDNDELHITNSALKPGKHTVAVSFSGTINDAMHGLYLCYFEHDGVKKELLATQFESHHAREVFPCVDEPEAKATFDVTLITEPNVAVLCNMPIKSQKNKNKLLVTTFETTPRMSTYLLAWVTGELQRKTAMTNKGVEVNVWSTPAQTIKSLEFALDTAVRCIEFYEEYFDTPYPLPKSDHVALPDFSSGAMENWGLITYREIALLADPQTNSINSKQYVATVIAHELAHQWFGNLVTMKWWNNLWLNESFATLMEYIAIDALYPNWNIWLDFATNESITALRRDSISGVQSVQVEVHHPDEIGTLFDGAIVYAKGARLLRMLQHFVGSQSFQAGLKQYFKDYAYKNTEGDDLWRAISLTSGKDISSLMNTWISQPGYPVVRASQKDGMISISQEQFFVGPHQPSNALWPIPLNSSSEEMPALLTTKSLAIQIPDISSFRLNIGNTAHFITYYDSLLVRQLVNSVSDGSMPLIDRLQLLNEATLLARASILQSVQLIDLIQAYQNETSEQVWVVISIALAELRKFVETDKKAEAKLRTISADIAAVQYQRLGWTKKPNEDESDTKLRSTIIGMVLYGESQDAINTAKEIYATTELKNIDAELRPLILSTVVKYGGKTIVNKLLARYKSSQSGELCQDIAIGITSTRLPDKIAELLDVIKDSSTVRPQDAARWFVYLIRGHESRDQAWQWIRNNWQWVVDTFGSDKSYDEYPRYSAGALITRDQLKEYEDFFGPMKNIPALSRVIAMGISEIEGRVALIERDGPAVRAMLRNL